MVTAERLVIYTEGENGPSCGLDQEIIRRAGGTLRCFKAADEAERLRLAAPAEVLVVGAARLTREVLSALPRLNGMVRTGIGVDTVDLPAATDLGIAVANVPDFCQEEVAEHTLALILAVARKVVESDRLVRGGEWQYGGQARMLPMRRLSGRTLGLIGFGRIGQCVARKAAALGLHAIAFDPYLNSPAGEVSGVRLVPLEELLRRADIVSLHVPLTPETRHLINPGTLSLMKPEAILINTARGPAVDEAALREALASGRLAGAGLDVLEQEPPRLTHPLFELGNVVLTCHYASLSEESYANLRRQLSEQIAEMLQGEFPRHLVNRELKNLPQRRLGQVSVGRGPAS